MKLDMSTFFVPSLFYPHLNFFTLPLLKLFYPHFLTFYPHFFTPFFYPHFFYTHPIFLTPPLFFPSFCTPLFLTFFLPALFLHPLILTSYFILLSTVALSELREWHYYLGTLALKYDLVTYTFISDLHKILLAPDLHFKIDTSNFGK